MKKIFALILLTVSLLSHAQIPDYFANNPAWSFSFSNSAAVATQHTKSTYYIKGDTLIDNIKYNLFYKRSYNFESFFGNETSITTKMVFPIRQVERALYKYENEREELIIDYNILIQDTIRNDEDEWDGYVSKIDSIKINDSYRKKLYYNYGPNKKYETIYIEGIVEITDEIGGMFGFGGITLRPNSIKNGTGTSMNAYYQNEQLFWSDKNIYPHFVKGTLSYFTENQKWSLMGDNTMSKYPYAYSFESGKKGCFDLPFVKVYRSEICPDDCQTPSQALVGTYFQNYKSVYELTLCDNVSSDYQLFISYNLSIGDTVKGSMVEGGQWIVDQVEKLIINDKIHLVFSGMTDNEKSFEIIEGIGYSIDDTFGEFFLPVSSLDTASRQLNCYSKNNLTVWQRDPLIECDYITSIRSKKDSYTILNLYPNPVMDQLTIISKKKLDGEIRISNTQGQIVQIFKSTNSLESNLDLSNLEKGPYILELFYKNGESSHQRFIKQ